MGPKRFFYTFLLLLGVTRSGYADNSTLCDTAECHQLSKHLYSLMNPLESPCENFYQFTCGGYLAEHQQVEPGVDSVGMADISAQIVYEAVKKGLESVKDHNKKSPKAFKLAKRYYDHCYEYEPSEESSQIDVVDYLVNFAPWPFVEKHWSGDKFDPIRTVARLQAELQLPTLAATEIGLDKLNTDRMTVYLKEAQLLYPVQRFNESLFPEFPEKYIESVTKALQQLAVNAKITHLTTKKIHKIASEIFEFENDLAKHIQLVQGVDEYNIFKHYNPLKLEDFSLIFGNSTSVLPSYFTTIVGSNERTLRWLKENRIVVTQLDYFHYLGQKLTHTEPRIVANYLMWRLMVFLGPFFDKEYMIVDGIPAEESTRPKRMAEGKIRKKGDCLLETIKMFPYVAGRMYVDRQFSLLKLQSAQNLTTSILDATRVVFMENTWLTIEAKRRIIEKLDVMLLNVGYPSWILNDTRLFEYYRNYRVHSNGSSFFHNQLMFKKFKTASLFDPIDRAKFHSDITSTSGPVYFPLTNTLTAPAAQFEFPFFQLGFPDFHNYATVGSAMGHEILHAFDSTGAQYDVFDNATRSFLTSSPWVLENSVENFTERSNCFVSDYNNYCYNFTGLSNKTEDETLEALINDNCVSGATTVAETIADYHGLRAARKAFGKRVDLKQNVNLPGFDRFTEEQMFFLSYGSSMCSRTARDSVVVRRQMIDVRPPSDARLNALLKNFPEFRDAFQCRPDDFMYANTLGSHCELY